MLARLIEGKKTALLPLPGIDGRRARAEHSAVREFQDAGADQCVAAVLLGRINNHSAGARLHITALTGELTDRTADFAAHAPGV